MRAELRSLVSKTKRWVFAGAEVRAWRKACRRARKVPRFTPGKIRLMDYELLYGDLLTLCPQWHDIFVRQLLSFCSTRPDPRIVDCGANVGLSVLYFRKLYPRARVTAVEADPALCRLLAENLRRNGAGDVEVVGAAVWTRDGEVSFRSEGGDSGAIERFACGVDGRSIRVPCFRLRDWLAREEVDLLKLDIEGAEEEVLRDCSDVLSNVRAVVAEVHEFDPRRRALGEVFGILERAGFRSTVVDWTPLPWRSKGRVEEGAFPGSSLAWTCLLRAWREENRGRESVGQASSFFSDGLLRSGRKKDGFPGSRV